MYNILFKASFAENKLTSIIELTKQQISRHVNIFKISQEKAKEKAYDGLWDTWNEESLLIQFLLNPGIECFRTEIDSSDLVQCLKLQLKNIVIYCCENNKTVKDISSCKNTDKLTFNIPNRFGDLKSKSKDELMTIYQFITQDSFLTRFQKAKLISSKTINRSSSVDEFINQILIENELPLIVKRNQSRIDAQKAISKGKATNKQFSQIHIFDATNVRSVLDAQYDFNCISNELEMPLIATIY